MQIAGLQTTVSPYTTGHPLGLPEVEKTPVVEMIKPITKRGDPDAAMAEGRPPDQFWRAINGEPDLETHIAPPSIIQIKISLMLEEQATGPAFEDPIANSNEEPVIHTQALDSEVQDSDRAENEQTTPSLPAYEEVAALGPEDPPVEQNDVPATDSMEPFTDA